MKNLMKWIAFVLALIVLALVLAGHMRAARQNADPTHAAKEPVETAAPAETPMPTPEATPAPTVLPEPTPEATPTPAETPEPTPEATPAPAETPEPTPEATPAPAETPAPSAAPAGSPVITKSPTDEAVIVGGSCYFVARYEKADWAVWHFISPDGQQDIDFREINRVFPTLEVVNGGTSVLQLKSIPEEMDGWRVYCAFSNKIGEVNTASALLTVTPSDAGAPKVTKSPTDETVKAGGTAYFVARHQEAIWAVWHFVSPDGKEDLDYLKAAEKFKDMQIISGDQSTMQLKNIPAELDGWKVYCAFSNNIGVTNTDAAKITVS